MEEFRERMVSHGYQQRGEFRYDNFCGTEGEDAAEWRKMNFREPADGRRVHIHVREQGRLNQRYALLFRDFVRANKTIRVGYEITKRRLAEIFPECIDGYLYIKDPFMDVMFESARIWAREADWAFDQDYL